MREASKHYPDLLSESDITLLLCSGPLTWQKNAVRLGLLDFTTPFAVFGGEKDEFHYFIDNWGGKAIAWTQDKDSNHLRAAEVVARLSKMSTPSIIEASIDVYDIPEDNPLWPTAVGGLINCAEPWTGWSMKVCAKSIVEVIQSDSERWPFSTDTSR